MGARELHAGGIRRCFCYYLYSYCLDKSITAVSYLNSIINQPHIVVAVALLYSVENKAKNCVINCNDY